MTSTKDRTWINIHLKTEMHKRLNAWCRRNGLKQQDGVEAMIDICAREVNGLQLVRRPDPPPIVHAPLPRAAPVPVRAAAPPDPALAAELDKLRTSNYYREVVGLAAQTLEEKRAGDAEDARILAEQQDREEREGMEWEEQERLDAEEANALGSANGSTHTTDDEIEAQAGEPDIDAIDARPH
jgi:hypothetical protein